MGLRKMVPATAAGLLVALVGCVVVHPSNVSLTGIGSRSPKHSSEPAAETTYAHALRKVDRQQDRVARELEEGDWKELADEAGDWLEYTRELLGYANSSHDPERFRRYTTELLAHVQRFRKAVYDHDFQACRRTLGATDPLLNEFFRDFPLAIDGTHPRPARVAVHARTDEATTAEVHVRVP